MKILSLFVLESTRWQSEHSDLVMEVVLVGIAHVEQWGREGDWVGVLNPAVAAQEWGEHCPHELTDKTLWVKLGLLKIPWCGDW